MLTKHRAPYIVAYRDGSHRILRDGVIVTEDDRIAYVGAEFEGEVDETVEHNAVIAPGFISTHCHVDGSVYDKGMTEDISKRQFWSTNLIEILPPKIAATSAEAGLLSAAFSIAEHVRTGTTTIMQMGGQPYEIAELCRAVGLRAYIGDLYASGEWRTRDGKRVEYDWLGDDGFSALDRAIEFAEHHRNPGGADLITGFLNPSEDDTCSADLLRASIKASEELGLRLQIHTGESLTAFLENTRRNGRTPVEWLHDLGVLTPQTILGHCMFIAGNSWTGFYGDDLGLIVDSGAHVAHNPWTFARNGIVMEGLAEYLRRGVSLGLGTDTANQSMLEAMRWAAILGKVVARRADAPTAADVFNAATLGGAAALGRDDIGRLEASAKADLVFWNLDSPYLTPMRDPIRSIVYYAQHSDIERVIIDGVEVLSEGRIQGYDPAQLYRVQEAAESIWARWPEVDWAGRTLDEHVVHSFPEF